MVDFCHGLFSEFGFIHYQIRLPASLESFPLQESLVYRRCENLQLFIDGCGPEKAHIKSEIFQHLRRIIAQHASGTFLYHSTAQQQLSLAVFQKSGNLQVIGHDHDIWHVLDSFCNFIGGRPGVQINVVSRRDEGRAPGGQSHLVLHMAGTFVCISHFLLCHRTSMASLKYIVFLQFFQIPSDRHCADFQVVSQVIHLHTPLHSDQFRYLCLPLCCQHTNHLLRIIVHDYMKILNIRTSTTPIAHAMVDVTDQVIS